MEKYEIKEALNFMDVATARGRAMSIGKGIPLEPKHDEKLMATQCRAEGYLNKSDEIAQMVRMRSAGITKEELESVEFIREQLRDLAKKAYENVVKEW